MTEDNTLPVYTVTVRIVEEGDGENIIAYRVKAASSEEAKEAVRLRRGWPANAGLMLSPGSVARMETRPDESGKSALDSAERFLFQPEVLRGLVDDALARADAPVKKIGDGRAVEAFGDGPIVINLDYNGRNPRVVVEVAARDSAITVFDGVEWIDAGPWVEKTCALLRAIEVAAMKTRRAHADSESDMRKAERAERQKILARAREVFDRAG